MAGASNVDAEQGMMATKTNLLVTGPSGSGKTTLLMGADERTPHLNKRGFVCPGIEADGVRCGWRIRALHGGTEGRLIAEDLVSDQRMGRFAVDMALFQQIVASQMVLDDTVDLYIIDEIGIVSGFLPDFEWRMNSLLDAAVRVLVIVRAQDRGFGQRVRTRADARVLEVSVDRRAYAEGVIADWLAI